MCNKYLLLHLTLIDGIGPNIIQKIMERSGVQASDLYLFSYTDLMNHCGITEKAAHRIVAGLADKSLLETELQLIEKHNINWMTVADESYPALLKEIYLPPIVLYWQGNYFQHRNPSIHSCGTLRASGGGQYLSRENMLDNESLNKSCDIFPFANSEHSFSARPECVEDVYRRVSPKCFAVVGSRKANAYGQNSINAIVPDLVSAGYTIVSGGAIGIDTMAHEATVRCGGTTIAILGSGLLRPYPSRNISLFKSIVENGGAVVSSFPLTMESLPGNFPARNRIVTGLSRGCLVVQAAQKSGALISANYAMEQGREVFAIPGHIGDELSAGCNQIIQEGAKLVTCSVDILQEFGDRIVQIDRQVIEQKAQQLYINSVVVKQSNEREEMLQYSAVQKDILRVCKKPTSLEDIIAITQLDFAVVQSELFNLQLDGVIEQDFAGMWNIC